MLIIIMHNNRDYLRFLARLAEKEGITDFAVIKRESVGIDLIGGNVNFIFTKGKALSVYKKAFVALVRENEKRDHFWDVIKNDRRLGLINMNDKGFMCAIPFRYIDAFRARKLPKAGGINDENN